MKNFKLIGILVVLAFAMMIMVSSTAMAKGNSKCKPDGKLGVHLVDPIKTESGYVSGTVHDSMYIAGETPYVTYEAMLGEIGKNVRIYRGIPYAAPPVGEWRWKPPQPVEPWEGIRECTHFSPMAPQSYPASSVYGSIPLEGMSEDVLYLNIQTPAKNANERLPVMVLFHGGGLTIGSVNRFSDNCPPLPQHGVVSVTVQHRIGVFGYMAHPALTAESGYDGSGNYGQMDLIAALKWVKRNIAAFGGDPNRVTIWGHSGGGMKTNFLLASPLAKGLFHRAICEAGFGTTARDLGDAEAMGRNVAFMAEVSDTDPVAELAAMRDKPFVEILDAAIASASPPYTHYYSSGFTIDNKYMPDTMGNIFAAGLHSDVPYMVGMGGAEIRLSTPSIGNLLQTMSENQKSPIYTYVFTHVPINWAWNGTSGIYAYHGLEVSYQYGVVDTVARLYGTSLLPVGSVPVSPGLNEDDYWLQDMVMTMWANFAATGDPTCAKSHKYKKYCKCNKKDKLITWDWPPYDSSDLYLDIGVPPIVSTGFSELVDKLPPRY